jgi:hypothetical protein
LRDRGQDSHRFVFNETDAVLGEAMQKLLDFMGGHPVLTVVIIIVFFGGLADIISALR